MRAAKTDRPAWHIALATLRQPDAEIIRRGTLYWRQAALPNPLRNGARDRAEPVVCTYLRFPELPRATTDCAIRVSHCGARRACFAQPGEKWRKGVFQLDEASLWREGECRAVGLAATRTP